MRAPNAALMLLIGAAPRVLGGVPKRARDLRLLHPRVRWQIRFGLSRLRVLGGVTLNVFATMYWHGRNHGGFEVEPSVGLRQALVVSFAGAWLSLTA